MEYGGITPVGLPDDWPILVDTAVAEHPEVVIGSGVRRSKLALSGAALAALKSAEVMSLGRTEANSRPLIGKPMGPVWTLYEWECGLMVHLVGGD